MTISVVQSRNPTAQSNEKNLCLKKNNIQVADFFLMFVNHVPDFYPKQILNSINLT